MASQGNAKPYVSPPRIDWINPLTDGLIGCYLPGSLQGIPIVGPSLARGDGGAGSRVVTKEGYAYSSTTTGSNKGFIGAAPLVFTGSALSIYWRGVLVGNADDFGVLIGVTYSNVNDTPSFVYGLEFDQTSFIANISTIWNTSGTPSKGNGVNTTSYRGNVASLCGTFLTGGNAVLYINGVSLDSVAFGAGAPFISNPQIVIDQYLPGTPLPPNANCNLVFFLYRQLSSSEILMFDKNPYDFLVYYDE